MRSDVAIGTCLSGGLDSSAIVCAANRLGHDGTLAHYTHHAFGYRSPDAGTNEAAHMARVADATSAKMHYVGFDAAAFMEALPQIVAAQDEPFASASIAAQWLVFREASAAGMKVMLDGQGADEILGGYPFYFQTLALARLARLDLGGLYRVRAAYQRDIGPFPMTGGLAARRLTARWAPRLDAILRRSSRLLWFRPLRVALTDALGKAEWVDSPAHDRAAVTVSLEERLQEDVRSLMLPAILRYEAEGREAVKETAEILEHKIAVERVLALLTREGTGVIKDRAEIEAVGHRIVHGGEHFKSSLQIDDEPRPAPRPARSPFLRGDDSGGFGPNASTTRDDFDIPTVLRRQMD
jgi:asparagine synthase (glutamine-hydrolysing)